MGTYDIGGGAASGAQSAAQGIGSGLKALAMGNAVAQQAEQNTALTLAKIFANQQSGNKHGAETSLLAKKLEDLNAVQADPTRATPVSQSYASVSGAAPFDNIGNTGRSLNRLTGQQIDAGSLVKTYDAEAMSRVGENNAQAGAARALMQQRMSALAGDGGDGNVKLTENQGNALIYGARARQAAANLEDLYGNYSPVAVNTKLYAEGIPVVGGALGAGVNMVTSSNNQKAEQAQRNFINAIMRRESGASIQPHEFDNANLQYFPQAGDSPEVLSQKKANRDVAIDALRIIAGPAGNKVNELSNRAIEAGKSPAINRKDILAQAKDAIARGANRKEVISELRSKYGIESAGF